MIWEKRGEADATSDSMGFLVPDVTLADHIIKKMHSTH